MSQQQNYLFHGINKEIETMSKTTNIKKNKTTNIKRSKNSSFEASTEKSTHGKRVVRLEAIAAMMMNRLRKQVAFRESFSVSPTVHVTFGVGQAVWSKDKPTDGLSRVMVTLGREVDENGLPIWLLTIPEGFSCDPEGAVYQVAIGCAVIAAQHGKGLSKTQVEHLKTKGHTQFQTYGVKRGKVAPALSGLGFEPVVVWERGVASVRPVGGSAANISYLRNRIDAFKSLATGSSNISVSLSRPEKKKEEEGAEGEESKGGSKAVLDFGTNEARQKVMNILGASSVADLQRLILEMVDTRVVKAEAEVKSQGRKLRSA
jgi:hypothetical protein